MEDIFGYEKTIKSEGAIISSQFGALLIGEKVALLQSTRGNYGREIRTMLETGSSNVFFVTGNSQGQMQCSAAVGEKGFFKQLGNGLKSCGTLENVGINLLTGRCTKGEGGLSFFGVHIRDLEFSLTTGAEAVTEGFSLVLAGMNRT